MVYFSIILLLLLFSFGGLIFDVLLKVKEPMFYWLLGGISVLAALAAVLCYNSWVYYG